MQEEGVLLSQADMLATKITMLEFALEITWANLLADGPIQSSENWRADFVRVMGKSYGPLTADRTEALRMRAMTYQSVEYAKKFVAKIERREAEIRARKAQGQ